MPYEGLQLGHFKLLNLIGSGGMGEVYLSEDTRIHRQVAVKVSRAELTPYPDVNATREAARLFLREMRVVTMLDHPHILPLYDFGEETISKVTLTYMVMPYRKEGSLNDWLRQRSSAEILLPQDVGYLIQQAASALQHAHDHHVIHQDVKPSNFLIHSTNDYPYLPDLLLADFGVAKFTTATSSMSHTIRGTPTYMAPEQWSGEPVPATDQYALAIMAYELLTGRPPFQGPPMRMMHLHATTPPQPPSTLNPQLSIDIDAVLLGALAKKPEDRFASIAAFAQALQRAVQVADPSTVFNRPQSNNLHATLAISEAEARTGTSRTLTLPGGRQVSVNISAGAYDGQIICLEGQGEPAGHDKLAGALILTLNVKHIAGDIPAPRPRLLEETIIPTGAASSVRTLPASNPQLRADTPLPLTDTEFQKSSRAQGFWGGKTIPLVGLVLLVLVASIGFYYLQGINHPASNNADTIATVQARDATAFAATSTAQAHNSTPAAATPTNVPTTNTNNYPPTSATLVLNDPLSANGSEYNWTENNSSSGVCSFTGGAYNVSSPITPLYHACAALNTNFSNFAYEVEMTIISGNCGALIFRSDITVKHYYFFRICHNGSYDLLVYAGSGYAVQTLVQCDASCSNPRIHTGLNQPNVVAVVANNDSISLYVNHQFITSVLDNTYSQGQIGVAADNDNSPTTVVFRNAKVWTL
jgi:serine/threonine protein kinase